MFKTSAWVKKHHDKENASAEKKKKWGNLRKSKKKRKREASLSQDKHAACAEWTEAAEL